MNLRSLLTFAIFLIVLSSCSYEEDTRLSCDFDYLSADGKISEKYRSPMKYENISLVFNESKQKFVLNGVSQTDYELLAPLRFDRDFVEIIIKDGVKRREVRFNRTTLILKMSDVNDPLIDIYLKCRVVDGV